MKHLGLSLTLLFALAGLSGCSGDNDADAGLADAGCSSDLMCPLADRCVDGSCVARPQGCSQTNPCGAGRTCMNMTCVPLPCAGHGVCGDLVCLQGMCADPPACTGGTCPSDLVCNPTTQKCEAMGVVSCSDDTGCTAPQICAGMECMDPLACNFGTDCPTGLHCVMGTCNDGCAQASDCGSQAILWNCSGAGDCQSRCINDQSCMSGAFCEGNVCLEAECTGDGNCGNDQVCEGEEDGHGHCIDVTRCTPGGNECQQNFECVVNVCTELPTCRGDRDCAADHYCGNRHCQVAVACPATACATGFDCIGGRCVPGTCRGECPTPGQVCLGGSCVAPPALTSVTEVRILSAAPYLSPGQGFIFVAIALNAAGSQVAGVSFDWNSSDALVATIDGTGLATAGTAGTSNITAAVDTGAGTITSAPVVLTVLPDHPNTFRVTVARESDGAPVTGATVVCGAETQTTNASGIAEMAPATPKTCTVYTPDRAWVTGVGLTGTEAFFSLPARSPSNAATGMNGMVDNSQAGGTGPVAISFNGGSFASPLWSFRVLDFMGGNTFRVPVPTIGDLDIPACTTASAMLMGFTLPLKDSYFAEVPAGYRRSWTFGGHVEIADVSAGMDLIGNVLPLLQTFRTSTERGYRTLVDMPVAPDADDLDGDGDMTEELPAYGSFVDVPEAPFQDQTMRVQYLLNGTSAPSNTQMIVALSGVLLPRVGFVPLGADGFNQTGALADFSAAMTPPYDGLESGEYMVMMGAQVPGTGGLPASFTAFTSVSRLLPSEVDFSGGFLAPATAAYMGTPRSLSVTGASTVWRARFRSTEGSWWVYAPAATTSFVLPTPPAGFTDRSTSGAIVVDSIELRSGDMGQLFAPGLDGNTADRVTRRFAQTPVR